MTIVTVGIDLAKNIFAVHGIHAAGKPELVRPSVNRAKLLDLLASLPPCLIGMEACSGAHHWARQWQKLGHTVRIIAPKFVAPYRLSGKRGKNDAADAAAICEAASRPHMRFVPIKSEEQQGQLMVRRARQGYVEQRTAAAMRKTEAGGYDKQDSISRWARSVAERRGYWKAVIAIAAKNARMCWAVLQRGENFKIPA